MKKIITAGCSYTRYKWPCWPSYVGLFEPGHTIRNLGAAGSSNETIMRSVHTAVSTHKDISKVYIMWSGSNRYEVVHDNIDSELKKKEEITYSRWNHDYEWNQFYGGHYLDDKHHYYVRHFQNERQNDVRTLEKILFTQMFLEKKNIEYRMMCFRADILIHDKSQMSRGHQALYDEIDWARFVFYKDKKGLYEYTTSEWPEQIDEPDDKHPYPLAHYHWVKDIMFKSDKNLTENEYDKVKNYFRYKNGRS